jgi:hypothetical protein
LHKLGRVIDAHALLLLLQFVGLIEAIDVGHGRNVAIEHGVGVRHVDLLA